MPWHSNNPWFLICVTKKIRSFYLCFVSHLYNTLVGLLGKILKSLDKLLQHMCAKLLKTKLVNYSTRNSTLFTLLLLQAGKSCNSATKHCNLQLARSLQKSCTWYRTRNYGLPMGQKLACIFFSMQNTGKLHAKHQCCHLVMLYIT